MYSKIYSRLDWFFDYIGEPQEDFIPDLYGDVNFDGSININDIVIMVNFILGTTPTDEQFITGDMNYDGIINIVDIILIVNEVLGTTFAQSVQWLEENFPSLKTKERLSKLDKSQFFSKILKCDKDLDEMNCDELKKEYKKLLKENKRLKTNVEFWKKMDMEKMIMLQKWSPVIQELSRYGDVSK